MRVRPGAILCSLFLLLPLRAAEIESSPLRRAKETAPPAKLFRSLNPAESGVDFVSPLLEDHPQNYLYHSGYGCGAVAMGDMDKNGLPDLFFSNGPGENALYLQKEVLRFSKAGPEMGLAGQHWATGCAMVDIEGDGDLDIYVCNYDRPNELFLNQLVPSGKLGFVESAKSLGLDLINASQMATFSDYDRDGDLDCFLLTNQFYRPGGRPEKPPFRTVNNQPKVLPEYARYYGLRRVGETNYTMDTYGQPDRLLRNDAGKFVDVTEKSGIAGEGHGLSATWWDYNGDGWPDLYVGNDFTEPDRLFHNNGTGTFTEVLGRVMPYCSWSSMGADAADINNDGWLDFFSADMAATTHQKQKVNMGDMSRHRWLMENGWPRQAMRNMLYLNTGSSRFMEIAFQAGVAQSDWTWAAKFADFDNDGWQDLFLSNGMVRNFSDADIPMTAEMLIGRTEWEIYKKTPRMREKNAAFRNSGELKFENVAAKWGLDQESMSYGIACGDLDGDGDQDLVVTNLGETASIFVNQSPASAQAIVQLNGQGNNRSAWGAVVRLEAGGLRQTRLVNPVSGFQTAGLNELHFGLGKAKVIDKLTVDWPSGTRQEFEKLEVGRRFVITEKAGQKSPGKPISEPLFQEVSESLGLNFTHREAAFDDYAREPLLPGKLSRFGPGQAWGDANGDGRDDLFMGGAAGQAGQLFLATENGNFLPVEGPWIKDTACEDMGMVWIDADSDGDLDLYVGSGGVEAEEGSPKLRDRLYINDGQARFQKAPDEALPPGAFSTSAVSASDFDADGDLDLFVGSRSVPGQYPKTPRSQLLRNDSREGKVQFSSVADALAPGLSGVGLVTGALWSDVDLDGQIDLLVSVEWGAVRLFRQNGGKFLDEAATGLAERKGWWNSIAGADLDNDGDTDYFVLNVGYNTKYGHPTPEKPSLLYYGVMDGSGKPQLIEAKKSTVEKEILPVRGLSCSSKAMPFLADKFRNYRAFAAADLGGIYTEDALSKATKLSANEFASGVLLNESKPGQVRFAWHPLPWLAQAAPGYGVVANDFDGDGNQDLAVIGNNFSREPETGLWRGGMGMLLRGNGKGSLDWQWPSETGFIVPDDGKSLSLADVNSDGKPDLVAAQNNGRLLVFQSQSKAQFLAVKVIGPKGNPAATGAVVSMEFSSGERERREIFAAGGYLSQSSATIFCALGERRAKEIAVAMPGGRKTVQQVPANSTTITINLR